MPLTNAGRARLAEYIRQRSCEEHRQGETVWIKGKGLVDGMHPGCREADEMIDMVQGA